MPLFLVAFAPFYRIERLWTDRPRGCCGLWFSGRPERPSPRDLSAPRGRPVGLARLEMVRLVDEEALTADDEVESVGAQPLGDPAGCLPGEQRRCVDAGVERRRERPDPASTGGRGTSRADRRRTHPDRVRGRRPSRPCPPRTGAAAFARHAVDVRRSPRRRRGRLRRSAPGSRRGPRRPSSRGAAPIPSAMCWATAWVLPNIDSYTTSARTAISSRPVGSGFRCRSWRPGRGAHGPMPSPQRTSKPMNWLARGKPRRSSGCRLGHTGPVPATTMPLDAQIEHIAAAPSDVGTVELVVARPGQG
jgi:hypothetical protein